MKKRYDIIIIGGGASGLLLLANICNKATKRTSITMINTGHPIARGIAYSTSNVNHLLNVRVSRMSAFTEDTNHFTNWILSKQEYSEYHSDSLGECFVPRKMYGHYLDELYHSIISDHSKNIDFTYIDDVVIDLKKSENIFTVLLKNNQAIEGVKAVLCTGNQPPITLPGLSSLKNSDRIFINPWDEKAVENINQDEPVFIIGAGLTMVDTAISLIDQGFKNKIIVLSKHGAIPLPHPNERVTVPHSDIVPPSDLHKIFSNLKARIRSAIDNTEWHEPVLEAVRPYTQKIWQELSIEEKNRFMRHINHRWSKLRHRLPLQVYDFIQALIAKNQVELYAGKLISVEENQESLTVEFFNKESNSIIKKEVQRIINCIGPEGNISKVENPLINNMLTSGMIANDALSLGFNATGDGKIINKQGEIVENLFTIGSGLRGILWESTAIPEIRVQAHQMATELVIQYH